jgi:hypothetical protein
LGKCYIERHGSSTVPYRTAVRHKSCRLTCTRCGLDRGPYCQESCHLTCCHCVLSRQLSPRHMLPWCIVQTAVASSHATAVYCLDSYRLVTCYHDVLSRQLSPRHMLPLCIVQTTVASSHAAVASSHAAVASSHAVVASSRATAVDVMEAVPVPPRPPTHPPTG